MKTHVDIHRIASEGDRIYEKIKDQYIDKHRGEFLAINVDTKEVFLGKTNAEAVRKAEKKYPDAIFYVERIGYSAVATLEAMTRA